MASHVTVHIVDGAGRAFRQGDILLSAWRRIEDKKSRFIDADQVELSVDETAPGPLVVVASAKQRHQCGFIATKDTAGKFPERLHLMLIHKNERLDFEPELWDQLHVRCPEWRGFLDANLSEKPKVEQLAGTGAKELACLLNVMEAMRGLEKGEAVIHAIEKIEVRARPKDEGRTWRGIQQDRVFAFANKTLVDLLDELARSQAKMHEENPAVVRAFHSPADRGFKEDRFGEANLNFSIVTDRNELLKLGADPARQVLVDIDLDFFRDVGAHVFLEVIPNGLKRKLRLNGRTNPIRIYALRWMAAMNKDPCKPFLPLYEVSGG